MQWSKQPMRQYISNGHASLLVYLQHRMLESEIPAV